MLTLTEGKVCTHCGTFRSYAEFHFRKVKGRITGYDSWCIPCRTVINRNYARLNKTFNPGPDLRRKIEYGATGTTALKLLGDW